MNEEIIQNNINFWNEYHQKEYWRMWKFKIKKFSHVPWCHACNNFNLEEIIKNLPRRK